MSGGGAASAEPASSSLDTLRNFAIGVGNKITQAATAIERGVQDVVAMFPVIDLTAEQPVPEQTHWYGDENANIIAVQGGGPRVCSKCTYAGSPLLAHSCALCQTPFLQNAAIANGGGAARKPKSSIYPSL